MTYYVFGDTGGHFIPLFNALTEIGLDTKTHKLPPHATIIHIGDLVHKGKDGDDIIALIDSIKQASPGQWIQLMGNHESFYLGGLNFVSEREHISLASQETLRNWLEEGFLRYAYAVTGDLTIATARGNHVLPAGTLFTHAGLEPRFYENILESVPLADIPRALLTHEKAVLTSPGDLLPLRPMTAETPVSPIWAIGVDEVWERWMDESDENIVPFNQVVGHIYPWLFSDDTWHVYPGDDFAEQALLLLEEWSVLAPMRDKFMVFSDPGFTSIRTTNIQPYLTITA